MVKTKNLSELAQYKQIKKNEGLNPFEVHVNKDKQKILGQKNKNDRGLPGVSRAKAINRRKHSLLQDYKLKNKDNIFLDRRIGETNFTMSAENKVMARFIMERMKMHKKKSIFSLNDDEVLTHRGQTLEEIEKFDDPKSDDEFSDNENSDKLDRNFVEEAHFGGGVLSKSDSTLSRKDLIDQLIAESKKRKAEKQKIREQTINLTEKLDSEWKDLLPLMSSSKKYEENISETMKTDIYDITVRELKFEARGNPSEKLKSEEQIIQEEKERLEALETDRLARMKGFISDTNNQHKHRSADDLDDGFMVESIIEETYDNFDNNSMANNCEDDSNNENSDIDDENKTDNDKIDDNDINDNKCKKTKLYSIIEEKIKNDVKINQNCSRNQERIYLKSSDIKNGDIDSNNKTLEGNSSNEYEESKDDFSDLKISSSEDENETVKNNNNNIYIQNLLDKNKQQEIINVLEQKKIMEKARKELPYTYDVPETFEELERLLENYNSEYQAIIVDRIIKCNHWTLDSKNKERLSNLFVYLLQHINNCASTDNSNNLIKCFQIFDRLCPYLYDLAHMNAENAKTCIQEIIKEKHDKFEKNKRRYPNMNTLIFFKLVSLLFPTSDFKHPVVTPCLIFMSQILLNSRIKNRQDFAKGLFICTLILEYTVLNRRFSPSVINFLRGIIYTATPEASIQKIKVIPPFKTTYNFLTINKKQIDFEIDPNGIHMTASDLIHKEFDDEFKIKALVTAVNLIKEFKNQLQELEAVYSIFEPIFKLLKINKFKKYPVNIKEHIKELCTELKLLRSKKVKYIVLEKNGPKLLRLYEPKIMTVYDGKQYKPMSKEKAEKEKLLHKYKREMKGAIREIRQDNVFLAKVQISQQIKNDAERKRKVREIFGEAALQQNELKKIKRKK